MVDVLMLMSLIFKVLYSPELDFRIFVWPVCSSVLDLVGFLDAPTYSLYT